jgi:hypothetical protein
VFSTKILHIMPSSSSSSTARSRPRHRGRRVPYSSVQRLGTSSLSSSLSYDAGNARVYRFAQYLPEATISQTAITNAYYAGGNLAVLTPSLTTLDQATSFQALFDQYRITKVTMQFRPLYSRQNFVPGSDIPPLIYTVVDYDDGAVPSSLATLREYQNITVHECDSFVVAFRPRIAMAAYGGAFTSYANMGNTWIDCASSGVLHYGLKIAITAGLAGQTHLQSWYLSVKLEVEFRNVR